MKLYEITLCGPFYGVGSGPANPFYVVARDATAAYDTLRRTLDSRETGFPRDREMQTIELLAEATECPDCKHRLLLADEAKP